MATFTQQTWTATQSIYDAIIAHPYNQTLADGTLESDRFTYYVQQDSLYLRDYTKALTLLAAKTDDAAEAHDLLTYARDAIDVERALHQMMSETFKIPATEVQEPACFAYTHFLLAKTSLAPYPVGLAAVLPCFWIYREVGLHIASQTVPDNPYQAWIDTYSDPGFGAVVDRMIAITDQAAEQSSLEIREAMHLAYRQSSQCEWAFWDAAYQLQRWPV